MNRARGRPVNLDSIGIYTGLHDALDGATKEIIPGRHPWGSRSDARRWLADRYRALIVETADRYGVTESAIRKHGPGVSPFFPSVAAIFDGAL